MGYYTRFELSYDMPEQDKSSAVNDFVAECRKKKVKIPTEVRVEFDQALDLEAKLEAVLTDEGW